MKISVVGCGYLGAVHAAAMVQLGHVVVGIDPEGRMYLLDLWRKQASSDQWVESFCDLVLQWKPIGWAEEQGSGACGI